MSKRRFKSSFPADRVRPVIQAWIEHENTRITGGQGAVTRLEERSGVDARQIYALLNGERRYIYLNVLDSLLCAIDRVDLFHSDLADIYEEAA